MTAITKAKPGHAPGDSLGPVLAAAAGRLGLAGIESARLDVRLLAARVLGWDQARVMARPEYSLTMEQGQNLEALIARRERREPLAYITGGREFWGLEFLVGPDTLVPRPESETIIEAALESITDPKAPLTILDLGTGSGCLLLALLRELPNATGLGVDVSPAALAVARDNARALGLEGRARFEPSDWGGELDADEGRFGLIVANPPYVADGEFAGLEPEVARFEPRLALSGGPDGLDCYRAMTPQIARLLAPGGLALVEIGAGQARPVGVIFQQQDLEISRVHDDLAACSRVVSASKVNRK
jgi:release factor glutamine methyltransferase